MRIDLLVILVVCCCLLSAGKVCALGEGPSLPEAMQFEPADATDSVNLATGDFAHVLPLFAVPGPAGDYPLSMSYHSRIGPNQEATWVGLGWTLNPGAVNRTVNGYPDDYRQDFVRAHFESPGFSGYSVGFGFSFGYGYGSVGLNMTYDSFSGSFGVNAIATLMNQAAVLGKDSLEIQAGTQGVGVGFSSEKGFGSSALFGSSGATFSAHGGYGPIGAQSSVTVTSEGVKAASVGGGLQVPPPLNTNIGFTLSSNGSVQPDFRVVGFGWQTMSNAGPGRSWSTSNGITLPFLPFFSLNLAASEWGWYLDETYQDVSYGYLYQTEYLNDPRERFEAVDYTLYQKKFERMEVGQTLYPAQDVYLVAAQGLGGVFRPFARKMVTLKDGLNSASKGQLIPVPQVGSNTRDDIVSRFLNDSGANLTTLSVPHPSGLAYQPANIFPDRNESRTIQAHYNAVSGKIEGFHITDAQGATYEFDQPVWSWVEKTWSKETTQQQVGDRSVDVTLESTRLLGSEYATNWLLTAIKGPDYVDRNHNGEVDGDDWGYWVRFRYQRIARPQIWRSPYTGTGSPATSKDVEMTSAGLRDMVTLRSVETPTHVAMFTTSPRDDRRTPMVTESLPLPPKSSSFYWPNNDLFTYAYKFPGDWRDVYQALADDTEFLDLSYWDYTPDELIAYGNHFRLSKALSGNATTFGGDTSCDWTIEYDGYYTVFTINFRGFHGGRLSVYEANLLTQSFFPTQYSDASKLDRIDLYSRNDPHVWLDNGWRVAPEAESLRSAVLRYDYSLAPGTPSSTAGGKLTLLSVEFLGRGGSNSGIPPYRFDYGFNPRYQEDDWDNWGSFRSSQSGRGRRLHHTPQNKPEADQAAAWSLTGITTPTGARIGIEYESDDYYAVADFIDDLKLDAASAAGTIETQAYEVLPQSAANTVLVGNEIGLHPNNAALHSRIVAEQIGFAPGRYLAVIESPHHTASYPQPESLLIRRITRRGISQRAVVSGGTLTQQFDGILLTFDGDQLPFDPGKRYFVKLYPRKVFGGGTRVRTMSLNDGGRLFRTRYRYEDESGFSTGVTASLPALYEDVRPHYRLLDGATGSRSASAFAHENPHRSAPLVIYSRVEVLNVDENDRPLGGKTVYEFVTSKDHPLDQRTLQINTCCREGDRTGANSVTAFFDRSAIFGMPTAVTDYELGGDGSQLPVRRQETAYALSDELEAWARVLRPDGSRVVNSPIGMTHERHAFENDWGREHWGSERVTYTNGDVSKFYLNVYSVGATTSFYHSGQPDAVNRTRNYAFDPLSGTVIGDAAERSDHIVELRQRTAAHWRYSALRGKNMLTQLAADTLYTAALNLSASDELLEVQFPPDQIKSGTVTTWKQWEDGIWRRNDFYEYNPQGDRQSLSAYSPFTSWDYDLPQFPAVTADFPCRMTSNYTAYTPFSQPSEEVNSVGQYDSLLYDERGVLPIAFVKHARRGDAYVFDFETERGLHTGGTPATFFTSGGRTGARAFRAYTAAAPYYELPWLVAQQGYTVSFWARKGTADRTQRLRITLSGPAMNNIAWPQYRSLESDTAWNYIELTIVPLQSGVARISLDLEPLPQQGGRYHVIDDLRVAPSGATMKVFTFDRLTSQLTAVSDENNLVRSFEYDSWGRLVLIRDDDGYIRNRYQYHFARP